MAICDITLNGLAQACDASVGGIKNVYLAKFDDVVVAKAGVEAGELDMTITEQTHPTADITVKTSATKFQRYYVRRGSSSMTSTLTVDDANGVSYVSTDLVLTFAKMDKEKRAEIEALTVKAADLAVIVEDANGQRWYLGAGNPVLRSAAAGQTGQAMGDANNYSITLNDTSAYWPIPIKGDIDSIIESTTAAGE